MSILVVDGYADGCNVVSHCESAVNDDTKVTNTLLCCKRDGRMRISPAVIASEPYQLCLLRIQSQPVGAHPCGDISDAVGKLTNGILGAVYRRVDVHLTAVGVEVSTCSMRSYNAEDL